jgi:adenylate kinase family enzyme
MVIQGPPASGKSYLGNLLARHFNIPLISISDVVNMVNGLEEELQNEIKDAVEAQRSEMAEKEQEKMNELKDKREKMGIAIVEEVPYIYARTMWLILICLNPEFRMNYFTSFIN